MRASRRSSSFDDCIHLFLGKTAVRSPRRPGTLHLAADLLDGNEVGIVQHLRLKTADQPSDLSPFLAPGRIFSTSPCGAGITWTATSSPTRRAAAAPASVAAFTD